jgi:hypothetical protein
MATAGLPQITQGDGSSMTIDIRRQQRTCGLGTIINRCSHAPDGAELALPRSEPGVASGPADMIGPCRRLADAFFIASDDSHVGDAAQVFLYLEQL